MPGWRVGVVGAGPAIQAIHLPTLALFGDALQVTHVMDPDATIASGVAEPLAAKPVTTLYEMLADGIDIAVIASPNAYHADQIEQLCDSGVRGILAEKPLGTSPDEVARVAAAVTQHSVALVVGAMHLYDPAWLAIDPASLGAGPFHARCAVYIPPNPYFEDMATTMIRPPATIHSDPPSAADILRGGILGLAIHDLPLIRRFIPQLEQVFVAETLAPWGYVITASGPAGSVELLARTGGTWRPDWTLDIWGSEAQLSIAFPPSYVHTGSAIATLTSQDGVTKFGPYPTDGYIAEWREMLNLMTGAPAHYLLDDVIADIDYALALAHLAANASS